MRWDSAVEASEPVSGPSDTGLAIAPVRVAGGRSTRAVGGTIAMVLGLGLAIAKPWAAAPAGPARASPDVVAVVAPSAFAPISDTPRSTRQGPQERDARAPDARGLRVSEWTRLAADADDLAGQPIVSTRDLGGSDGDGTCGGSARVTSFDELIAVSLPAGERVAAARLFAIDTIRQRDIPIRLVADRPGPLDGRAIDGLALIALPAGGIAARQYALVARTLGPSGLATRTYTVCVG